MRQNFPIGELRLITVRTRVFVSHVLFPRSGVDTISLNPAFNLGYLVTVKSMESFTRILLARAAMRCLALRHVSLVPNPSLSVQMETVET